MDQINFKPYQNHYVDGNNTVTLTFKLISQQKSSWKLPASEV